MSCSRQPTERTRLRQARTFLVLSLRRAAIFQTRHSLTTGSIAAKGNTHSSETTFGSSHVLYPMTLALFSRG
jgi:hypothetical protein